MSKKNKQRQQPSEQQPQIYSLAKFESDSLHNLIQQRQYADFVVRDYILRLLADRKLDPTVWGVSQDLLRIQRIQQPVPPPNSTIQVPPR